MMHGGAVEAKPRDEYDNEIGCHITAVRGMQGEATRLFERLRRIADATLGQLPPSVTETGKDPAAPHAPHNGSLAELRATVSDLNGTLSLIGAQVTRLEKLC